MLNNVITILLTVLYVKIRIKLFLSCFYQYHILLMMVTKSTVTLTKKVVFVRNYLKILGVGVPSVFADA